jgi:hypothetical protein
MRTECIKVLTFEELSEEAKQKAIEKYRDTIDEIHWADENRNSMEKFAAIFPIKVRDWRYGGRGEGVSFYFEADDAIEELSGQRLATYIWNNYRKDLWHGHYYGRLSPTDKHGNLIPKSKEHPIGQRHVKRYSKILLDFGDLTGYCMDYSLCKPIEEFLNKPDSSNFKDLLESCFDAWVKACNEDVEWQQSDEYITDILVSNEYEFEEDGTRF